MGGLLIRPLISKLPINSCTADHQHRTSSLSSLRSPAETSKTPSGEKKRARNPVLKTGAGTLCSSPCRSQSHTSAREQQPVRVPPGSTQRHGAEQSGLWCPRSALCRWCPCSPVGWGCLHSGPFPRSPVTAGRRTHSPGKQTRSITFFFLTHR